MRVLVCGCRNADPEQVAERLDNTLNFLFEPGEVKMIIHGGAKGADDGAAILAYERQIAVRVFPADWNRYGKAAGAIRNQQMLDVGKPHIVVAFWDGKSKGTQDMIAKATAADVLVWIECAPIPEEPQQEMF